MRSVLGRLALGLGVAMALPVGAADLRLLMFEQSGCVYCARWNAEIAPQYPLTEEGKRAPLTRLQLRDALPDAITLTRPPAFTPTFVLLRDGMESGRIEGYPGEDFFWPMLAALILDADEAKAERHDAMPLQ